MKEKLESLKAQVAILETEVETLTTKKIKAASPRARKALQEIKTIATALRQDVQEFRNGL